MSSEKYNSRKARREAERLRANAVMDYEERFKNLLHNAVKIKNLPDDLPKRYLLDTLYGEGKIGYDVETGLFLPVNETGSVDAYGITKQITLHGANGITLTRNRDPKEVVILRANDRQTGVYSYITQQAEKLVDFDTAINQNLDAIRTQTILQVNDETQLLTLINSYESRRLGSTVAYVNKNSGVEDCFRVASTNAEYLVDKLQNDRKSVMFETLETLGLVGEQQEKKESVQGFEQVNAMTLCVSNIFVVIDTFNHDAELGNLDIRLEANTPTVELMNIDPVSGEMEEPVDNYVTKEGVKRDGESEEDME